MKDEKFRKLLGELIEEEGIEEEDQPLLLTDHSYDKSIIGLTALDGRVVYSYESMVQEFMEDEGCEAADAIEWLEYNTMRAIGYGDTGHNPIIVTLSREAIEERMFILDYPDTSEKKQGKEGE